MAYRRNSGGSSKLVVGFLTILIAVTAFCRLSNTQYTELDLTCSDGNAGYFRPRLRLQQHFPPLNLSQYRLVAQKANLVANYYQSLS